MGTDRIGAGMSMSLAEVPLQVSPYLKANGKLDTSMEMIAAKGRTLEIPPLVDGSEKRSC